MGNQEGRGQKQPSAGEVSEAQHRMVARKVFDVEKRVQDLETTVNNKNQWNNIARGWVDTQVTVRLLTGDVSGALQALDRYTLLVKGCHFSDTTYTDGGVSMTNKLRQESSPKEIVIHKGAIASICQGEFTP